MSIVSLSNPNIWIVFLEYFGMFIMAILLLNDLIAEHRPSLRHLLLASFTMLVLFAPTLVIISQLTAVLHLVFPLVFLLVYLRIFVPSKLLQHIFWTLTLLLAATAFMTVTGLLSRIIAFGFALSYIPEQIVFSALTLTFEIVATIVVIKKRPFVYASIDRGLFVSVSIVLMFVLILVFAFRGYVYFGVAANATDITWYVNESWNAIAWLVVLISLTIFLFYLIVTRNANSLHMLEYESHVAGLERDYMTLFADASKEIHTLHHDLANHFTLLSGLAEQGDVAAISAYIAQTRDSISSMRALVATGNSTVDIILSHKLRHAQQIGTKGVEMDLHVLMPENLALSDFEMASLLGNLLDNALEATERVLAFNAGGGAFLSGTAIAVTIKQLGGNLLVRVENIAFKPDAAHESYVTSKPTRDEEGRHGIGLAQVQRLVKVHGGHLDLAFKPATAASFPEQNPGTTDTPALGTFTATVLLPLQSQSLIARER
jgi:signal transduction histidine kinase